MQAQGINPGATLVAPVHPIDEAALAAYLRAHVAAFSGPIGVEQFQGGQSNPTYRVTAGGRRYVLRRKPPGKLLPSAHAIDREYRVMAALADTDVPVAKMIALCDDDAVIGTAFYLMEYVEGRVLWDPTLPGLTPTARAAHYDGTEPRAGRAAPGRLSLPRASATSASPASTSSARSRAGRSNTRLAGPSAFPRWTR